MKHMARARDEDREPTGPRTSLSSSPSIVAAERAAWMDSNGDAKSDELAPRRAGPDATFGYKNLLRRAPFAMTATSFLRSSAINALSSTIVARTASTNETWAARGRTLVWDPEAVSPVPSGAAPAPPVVAAPVDGAASPASGPTGTGFQPPPPRDVAVGSRVRSDTPSRGFPALSTQLPMPVSMTTTSRLASPSEACRRPRFVDVGGGASTSDAALIAPDSTQGATSKPLPARQGARWKTFKQT
mmetsp:Transcript_6992/g.24876  ORF Transcript_6992/g.24876 Transcript_6992/m.24876 type:complete len:244 (+) Transcript_6992:620-1351(+)